MLVLSGCAYRWSPKRPGQTCVRCAARPPLDWGEAGARHSLFLFFCTLPGARSAGSRVGYRMDDFDDAIRVLDGACILHSLSKKKKTKTNKTNTHRVKLSSESPDRATATHRKSNSIGGCFCSLDISSFPIFYFGLSRTLGFFAIAC